MMNKRIESVADEECNRCELRHECPVWLGTTKFEDDCLLIYPDTPDAATIYTSDMLTSERRWYGGPGPLC